MSGTKKALITGITGQDGQHLSELLDSKGYEVFGLIRGQRNARREAFVAEPGNVLLSADYSQIELRLAAHMADVPELRRAFADGDDIHALTATELFGEVTRERRAQAKTINFAILYGISRWGLAGRLGISAVNVVEPLKRAFMAEARGESGDLPRLLTGATV